MGNHREAVDVDSKKALLAGELADVAIYCLMLADRCGIDLEDAVRAKTKANAVKYPIEKSFGRSTKYTELDAGAADLKKRSEFLK
jgi:MazG-like family